MDNKLGAVYTKPWVVRLMLDMVGYVAGTGLSGKSICEPSCGKGAFLSEIVERLIRDTGGTFDCEHLKDCIRAYDIDADNVQYCRNHVEVLLTSRGIDKKSAKRLSNVWIREADYLLTEDKKTYDYVVGNPPYLRATDIGPEKKKIYCDRLNSMTMGCDIYVGFYEKGLSSLNSDGVLCYICADRWMQNQYGKSLRGYINKTYHIENVIRVHDADVFEQGVSAYPAITKIRCGSGEMKYVVCSKDFSELDSENLLRWLGSSKEPCKDTNFTASTIDQPTGDQIITLPNLTKRCSNSTSKELVRIEESGVKIGIGLATGRDTVFLTHDANAVESSRMMPAFNMKDRRKGLTRETWFINPWDDKGELVDLKDFPLLNKYMLTHKKDLAQRHVAKKYPEKWYRTIDKFNRSIIGRPMLLFPDMAAKSEPVYSDGSRYPCHNCYWMVSDTWDLDVLGGLLISDIAEAFIDSNGVKMRGGTMRFQAQYLRLIRVPLPGSLTESTKTALSRAFKTNDRMLANKAAREAYGIG